MTKLEQVKAPTGYDERLSLVFDNGKTMKVHPGVVSEFGLYAGLLLDDETMERLHEAQGTAGTKARAVRIVSATNVSRRDLSRRLQQKGESEENAEAAVAWLSDLNLLDDEKTARQLAQSAAKKGYGKARIRQIFYQKGIPKELWEDAMEELPEPDEAIDRFVSARLRGSAPDEQQVRRLVAALQRRGHSWHDIQTALRRYTDALEEQMEDFE